jgi:hypothetical protein
MMSAAMINMSGVNFHGGSTNYYAVFTYAWSTSNHLIVRPLYYAMYVFAYATRGYPYFVPVSVESSVPTLLKSWAMVSTEDKTLRVLLLYKVSALLPPIL